jgi:hypothetical protein
MVESVAVWPEQREEGPSISTSVLEIFSISYYTVVHPFAGSVMVTS